MESIVITPKNGAEMKFVSELLSKIGLETRKLDDETKENMGLAFLMSKVDRKDIVDLEEFKKSLK
jgi:hypothetical protein